jgi:hypothetical protein
MRDPDGHIDGLTGLVQRMSLLPRLVRPMRRSVPTNRSAKEFARGERTGVLMIRAYTYKRLRNTVSTCRKSQARIPAAWEARNCRQVGDARRGAGVSPAATRILRIVPAPTRYPRPRSSPWMRRCPHCGFCLASRGGEPGRISVPGCLRQFGQLRVGIQRQQVQPVAGAAAGQRQNRTIAVVGEGGGVAGQPGGDLG